MLLKLPSQKSELKHSLTEDDVYGLLGLLGMIRGIDSDHKMMSGGCDLKRLGLGLNRP